MDCRLPSEAHYKTPEVFDSIPDFSPKNEEFEKNLKKAGKSFLVPIPKPKELFRAPKENINGFASKKAISFGTAFEEENTEPYDLVRLWKKGEVVLVPMGVVEKLSFWHSVGFVETREVVVDVENNLKIDLLLETFGIWEGFY